MTRAACCAALVLLGASARAQPGRQALDTAGARCDSILRAAVADSERTIVRGFLLRRDGDVLPGQVAGIVLQEFVAQFRPPRPMRIPVFAAGPVEMRTLRVLRVEPTALRRPFLDAAYALVMRRDGTASQIATLRPSLVPGLDSAAEARLAAMSAEKLFPYLSDEVSGDSIPLVMRLTTNSEGRGTELALFMSMFPKVPLVDATLREPVPEPVYPAEERAAGAEGDVLLQVVVDANGEPDLGTIEIMHATTRGFAVAAYDAVRQMRWTPAHVDGCNVPQAVSVPVVFSLPVARADSVARVKPH